MKRTLVVFLLAMFAVAGRAAGQPQYQANLGSVREAIARGEGPAVLAFLETQAAEAERSGEWAKAANAYNLACDAARSIGQLQKAITFGNKSLAAAEKGRLPVQEVSAMLYLVFAHRAAGQYAKAREWTDKGIETVKKLDHSFFRDRLEFNLYRMLGLDFLRQQQPQKAVEYIAYSLQVQDSLLSRLKRQPTSNAALIQTMANVQVGILYDLGTAYRRAGNQPEAVRAYERAVALIKETGLRSSMEGLIYYGLGSLYVNQKAYPLALEHLGKAVEMAEKQQLGNLIYLANGSMADAYLQTGKPAEAIPFYKKAIDSIESTRSLFESEESRSAFFEDKRGIYGGMVVAQLRAKHFAEAFNYAERARSRAFLDILGSRVQLARGGSLLEEERALQGRISALQARMAGQEEDSADRQRFRRELDEAQKAYNDFLARVRKADKEQASLMSVEPLTLKEVQVLLEPGVTMLEYFVTPGAVLLWVVEKDRLRYVNIPIPRAKLVGQVTSLRETIYQVAEKEKFRASSQELYKLLIEPALLYLRGKELLIVPHDVLHYVPFQALLSATGSYLIQEYPIYYLSSASLMQFTRGKKHAAGGRALVLGNPSLGDDAYNLRFAEREAREVANVYPQSAVYLKTEATKPTALSLSPKYDMLHFAVHAELSEEDPMGSALLLAGVGKEDGRLKVGEIFSLNLQANLVVLSACETGLGKLSNGDEMIGLTRAFIYAGTPSIVTTLWKVNDRASYELMKEFYQHLKAGKKSEALRQAQLKTMQEFPEPFYWAAYQLTGEP